MIKSPRTRSSAIVLLILIVLIGVYIFSNSSSEPEVQVTYPKKTLNTPPEEVKRKVMGLPPGQEEVPANVKISNTVAENWEEQLEESLKAQGGDSLKEIHIEKEASFVWIQNDIGINVESVRITIKNNQDEEVLFRALVDSQSGKIYETWDRPIEDVTDPKKNYRIKIDPRYLNQ